MAVGDRFLYTDSTTNQHGTSSASTSAGIYTFQGSGTPATRTNDWATGAIKEGALVIALEGSAPTNTLKGRGAYLLNASAAVTVNTTATSFTKLTTSNNGATLSGTTALASTSITGYLQQAVGAWGVAYETFSSSATLGNSFSSVYTGSGGHTGTLPVSNFVNNNSYPHVRFVRNEGSGDVTIAAGASGTINGGASIVLTAGWCVLIIGRGSNISDAYYLAPTASGGGSGLSEAQVVALIEDATEDLADIYHNHDTRYLTLSDGADKVYVDEAVDEAVNEAVSGTGTFAFFMGLM